MKSFFTDFRNVCHRRILLATNLLILFLLIGSQHMAAQDTSHIEPLLSDTNHVAIRDTTSPVIITQDTNKATTQNIIRNIPVHSVKGKITDEKGLPLFGVSVQIKGTDKGVVTSADGNYFIQVSDSAVLVFSYVGYVTEEIPVLGKSTVDISMGI
ncbi:MAG: carboxypeptidase-like regulatory domain-containing protein [Ferruginibacter sp.]